jgi:hypothetical protein
MKQPSSNPFAPPSTQLGVDELKASLSEDNVDSEAVCVQRGLLAIEVVKSGSHPWTLSYSGINFRQVIHLNGKVVWWCITWVWFQRFIEFYQPLAPGLPDSHWVVEVTIGRFLRLATFRITIDGQEVFRQT